MSSLCCNIKCSSDVSNRWGVRVILNVFFNEIKKCYDSNSIIENKLINPLNDLVKNGNNATLIKAVQNLKKYTRVADMLLHRKIKRDFSNNNYMFHSYKSPNNYKPSNYKITSDSWYNNAIIEKLLEKYINQDGRVHIANRKNCGGNMLDMNVTDMTDTWSNYEASKFCVEFQTQLIF